MNKISNNGLKVEKSRFASLKIENDDDEDDQVSHQKNDNNWQKVSHKKKGGAPNPKPNDQNKNAKSANPKPKKSNNNNGQNDQKAKVQLQLKSEDDWEVWREKDEQFADNLFKEQMKQAMIESKLDFECNKSASKKVTKKLNNKPVKMSLEEFHKKLDQPSHTQNTVQGPDENSEAEKFIEKIDEQLNDLLLRENRSHPSDKDALMEKFLCLQYQDQLEKKNAQIEELTNTVNTLKEEISQVKIRNKQLAFIISQGELKEKSELVNETIELNNVKNELTQQISELIKSLEQEKSKVHQLENELKKAIKSKH